MRELPVVLEEEERVLARANEHVEVRRHARERTAEGGLGHARGGGGALRERGAERALRERIHGPV